MARRKASRIIAHSDSVGIDAGPEPPGTTTAVKVLVKVHAMAAPAAVAAASSVTVRVAMFGVAVPPAPNPLQVIEERAKPTGGTPSVSVVITPAAVRDCVNADVAVPAVVVVIVWPAKPLLPVKVNEPVPPFDIFESVTVGTRPGAGSVLVKVQEIAAPAAVAAASNVTLRAGILTTAEPPAPSPLQLIEVSPKPAGGTPSVNVVLTLAAARNCVPPDTPVPGAVVVIDWARKPLVPVKLNVPTPPLDVLVTSIDGRGPAAHAPGRVITLESLV
ncbi:MAG: hypothetical protein ABIR98_12235, partial [Usitatibacter sp.]